MSAEKFWLVACADSVPTTHHDNGRAIKGEMLTRPSRFMHETQRGAEREAVRLATVTGGTFVVLEAQCSVVIDRGFPRWLDL